MNQSLIQTLRELIEIHSPTGYHKEIQPFVSQRLRNLGIEHQLLKKGGILAVLPGERPEAILFSAHMDTLGAMVKEIKSNGRLKIAMIGGCPWISLDAENCQVRTRKGDLISGTFQGTKPSVHIDGADVAKTERSQDTTEVILDAKVQSADDVRALGIDVGDFIFVDPRFQLTDTGFIKTRYLDDKASVAVLLEAMADLKDAPLKNTLYFFLSTYEEVGHGACAGIPAHVEEFIAVDMGAPGNGQNSSEFAVNICAKDSSGPYHFDVKERLVALCEELDIPYRQDIYNFYGSDASAALRAGADVRTGLIGAGVFASHGYERTHCDSMEATLNLVLAYAKAGMP
ncbi:Deblocking aminopeptidase [Clostridiaceae bacterium JG1575]|nr:Deblocking aminopeptidase [Clostridiaceae bacterium JG1575]